MSQFFMDKRRRASTILRQKYLSHSSEKSLTEISRVSENLGYRHFLCTTRGYHEVLSKICCLTKFKKIVHELFCVSEDIWYRYLWSIKVEASITSFFKKLLSHSDKNCRRNLLCFREFLSSKDVEDKGAGGYVDITIFSRNIVVSQ